MFKRKTTLSIIFSALALGLITTGFINNNDKVVEAKAEEEKVEYIYLDCSKPVSDGYSFFHPYVIFGGGANVSDYMMESVKDNVYKYPIPQGATLVNFEDHYVNGQTKSELWYDGHNWSIDIPETKRTFYINRYDSYGSITEVDAFFGEWRDNYDMPDEEGYYLVNSDNDYKFADSIKMDEGEHGDLAEAIQINAKSNQYLKVRSWFNNTNKTYPSSGKGYKPDNDKDVNIYISESDEFLVEDYINKPEEDGYYVFGTYGSEVVSEYIDAYKTTTFIDEKMNYVALYENIHLELNDSIYVKRYSSSSHPRQVIISPESTLSSDFEKYGDGVRLKQKWVDYFDVYIIDDGENIVFRPDRHSTKVLNPMTAVFCTYTGEVVRTQDLPEQLSYSNTRFYPDLVEMEGAKLTGEVYLDVNCTDEFNNWFISEPTHLYVKYLVPGYYFCHNRGEYQLMDTTNIEEDSLAEITIQPLNQEDMDTFIFISYDADSNIQEYELESSNYAINEVGYDGNKRLRDAIEFNAWTLGNYFRVSIKTDGKLHIKEAGSFFCNDFINDISNICDDTGLNTNIEALQGEWLEQKAAYQQVEYKQEIINIGFQYFESPETIYEEMMNKYYYIINKYGSETFENFIFPDMDPVLPNGIDNNVFLKYNDAAIFAAVISISVVGVSLLVTLLVFKKKKKSK